MHEIAIEWKEFNVSLSAVDTWMKANIEHYLGISADARLRLWFSQDPGEQALSTIQEYWDGLAEDSGEATTYKSANEIHDRIKELKEQIPSKTWNQLNTAQRKIVVGLEPTIEDLWA